MSKCKMLFKKYRLEVISYALEVGFKNEKYLIKVFEKYFSIPPDTYRRK
jgi:YesN/AraC family two-component response regulator